MASAAVVPVVVVSLRNTKVSVACGSVTESRVDPKPITRYSIR